LVLSGIFNFKTQMDVGKNDEYIPFFSPAYFQLGPDAMEEK
jgi:hypothetical protein